MAISEFPEATLTKYHKPESLQEKFLLSSSRGYESEIKVSAGLCSSEGTHGGSFPASSELLVVAGSPWHSLACSCITPISVTQSCPHMSVSSHGLLLSYKDVGHIGLRAHPTPV